MNVFESCLGLLPHAHACHSLAGRDVVSAAICMHADPCLLCCTLHTTSGACQSTCEHCISTRGAVDNIAGSMLSDWWWLEGDQRQQR